MGELHALTQHHPIVFWIACGNVIQIIFNAAVTTMPTPKSTSSEFYQWAFNFLHTLVGAWSRVASQYPRANGGQAPPPNPPTPPAAPVAK
jgi:hypothetical protein